VNPFPLVEVAVQLPESGKRIRQAFEVGGFLGLAFFHVLVGLILIHGRSLNSGWAAEF
jgi:hypothetical protein